MGRLHQIVTIIKLSTKIKCKRTKANKINRTLMWTKDRRNMKTMKYKILVKVRKRKRTKEKTTEIWMEERIWKAQAKWAPTSQLMVEWHSLKFKLEMIQWHMKTEIMKQKLKILRVFEKPSKDLYRLFFHFKIIFISKV